MPLYDTAVNGSKSAGAQLHHLRDAALVFAVGLLICAFSTAGLIAHRPCGNFYQFAASFITKEPCRVAAGLVIAFNQPGLTSSVATNTIGSVEVACFEA